MHSAHGWGAATLPAPHMQGYRVLQSTASRTHTRTRPKTVAIYSVAERSYGRCSSSHRPWPCTTQPDDSSLSARMLLGDADTTRHAQSIRTTNSSLAITLLATVAIQHFCTGGRVYDLLTFICGRHSTVRVSLATSRPASRSRVKRRDTASGFTTSGVWRVYIRARASLAGWHCRRIYHLAS